MAAHLIRIERIGLTVTNLDASRLFYERALGFREVARERRDGPAFEALTNLDNSSAEISVMRLGGQEIELVAFTPGGRAYPEERSAADPWFQHFAIVTSNMDAAFGGLAGMSGWTPISANGPQLLPPEKGSIIAFKFRDPDGHPLELSYFPPELGSRWSHRKGEALFLGIDHSALAVERIDTASEFYLRRLGMRPLGSQLNSGPTQAGLDGLADAEVEIASLGTTRPGPHLELLGYLGRQAWRTAGLKVNDVAATRLVAEVKNLGGLVAESEVELISRTTVTLAGGEIAAIIRSPDGHLLELHERQGRSKPPRS
jgi:catechol 2,3-dioxygenase-like lactoylglutathione lyase family enzyme